MKAFDVVVLLALGLIIWIGGTLYYAHFGAAILETTASRYWCSFALSPIVSAVLCVAVLRLLHIAPSQWTSAMLLLAIPGMAGEAVVLTHMATFMPRVHAASGGRYAAFLFATYAVVLALAEVVTLRAVPALR